MELLKNFGVEPISFLAQVVNFLIIFYILKRFMFGPVLQMLKKRKETIETGLSQAEEARVLLEQASEKEREILKKAQSEAKSLLEDAKKQAEEMIAASEHKTKTQADRMLKEAREQITQETKEAEKRLSGNISALAVQFLEKSLKETFSEKDQSAVLQRAIDDVKKKTNN